MSRRFNLLIILSLSMGCLSAADLEFSGSLLRVLEEIPDKNTGLDKIYVVYDTSQVDLIYRPENAAHVRILNYSNLGGGYAEEVSFVNEEGAVVVHDIKGNSGYIIEDGERRYYYWVVNYLPYRFDIKSVRKGDEIDCEATVLNVEGNGSPIHYFTINGQQRTLDRDIKVEYTSQEWDNETKDFVTKQMTKSFESMSTSLRIVPPAYSYTSFLVSGDKFLREWNWISEAESDVVSPTGIMVMSEALQEGILSSDSSSDSSSESGGNDGVTDSNDVGSNLITSGDSGLGGSAPAAISFVAYGTEGVLHNEWQMAKDPDFEEIEFRFNQREIDYTFNDEGTYYLRFIGSNSDGSCEAIGETFTVTIGASELKCPNAFSPDGDGVNDIWKVSYRSLLDFRCWIFDRFGHQIFYFDDPSSGWDGTRSGKLVNPGVYYYVIQATGADNKTYKKSGDINILRHRSVSSGMGGAETE